MGETDDTDNLPVKRRPRPSKRGGLVADVMRAKQILGIETFGNEKHMLRNTITLLNRRGDSPRLDSLKRLYFLSYPGSSELNIMKFYYWYRTTPISEDDEMLYHIYADVAAQHDVKSRIDPKYFSERGLEVMSKLLEWSGDCGNTMEELLKTYCTAVIRRAVGFNKALVTTPKSLLEDFGWRMFLEYIDDAGGKSSYLTPSIKEAQKESRLRKKLAHIASSRQRLLEQGHLAAYDEIGRILAEKGIEEAYRELYGDSVTSAAH